MSVLWRISNHSDLSGEGGRRGSARWHTRGRPIVYLADSPASAMLEQIVHLQDGNGKLPSFYHLLEIRAPEDMPIKDLLTMADAGWKQKLELTQRIGNAWLASLATPLARVPSAIVPRTWNYLLNPEHPDAVDVKIESATRERFDNRLFRFGPR